MLSITERDSNRDKAVVYVFIVATGTLLLWAAAKPLVGRWISVCVYLIIVCLIQVSTSMEWCRTFALWELKTDNSCVG